MGKTSKPWLKSWAIRVSASAEISSSTTEDASIFNKFWKSMKRNKESQAVTEKTMTCRFCTCQDLPEAVETHLPINKTGPLRPFPIRVSICLLCNFQTYMYGTKLNTAAYIILLVEAICLLQFYSVGSWLEF